ncbi:MAG: T9SS C-terminal target domain-containing protein, partial [Bacteroidetes bacterium]
IGTDTEETTDFLGNLLPISNFVGVIREARLWNVSRTSNQINNFKSVKLTPSLLLNDRIGLVSYLRLNDGAGATPIDLAREVMIGSNPNFGPALNGIGLYYDYYPGISPRSGSATSWSQATCSEMVFRKGADEETTPLTTTQSQDEVSIYPNPSSGMIEVSVNDTFLNATLEVYDMQGKKVMAQTIADLQTKMDLSNYQAGMYFIKIGTKTFKLILAK